jgi:VIT1/CCC1 family predicted Fe2+/Mn2+ transporter
MVWPVAIASLISLAVLGAVAARTGGAPMTLGALRVLFWSALAMAATAAIGSLFGVSA